MTSKLNNNKTTFLHLLTKFYLIKNFSARVKEIIDFIAENAVSNSTACDRYKRLQVDDEVQHQGLQEGHGASKLSKFND